MTNRLALMLCLFAMASPVSAMPGASQPDITAPIWLTSPHDPWTDGSIPEEAARLNQAGGATVRCTATAAGTLADCRVVDETPPDFGFGYAVLRVAKYVRMKPVDGAGEPIVGRSLTLTMRYDGSGHGLSDVHWAR